MKKNTDWIMASQKGFKDQVDQTFDYFLPGKDGFGFGSTTDNGKWLIATVLPAVNTHSTAFNAWKDKATRSEVSSFALEKARETLEPLYRHLARILKESVSVSDTDLEMMGLPRRGTGSYTHSPVETRAPWYRAQLIEICRVLIFYGNVLTAKKGKPRGQHGVECRWVIIDHQGVVHYSDLIYSTFDTASPLEMKFSDEDRGKYLYFAMRWENSVGDKAPFGEIMMVVIP